MKFRFAINTTEQDYIDFNLFVNTKLPFGKRMTIIVRSMVAAVTALFILASFVNDGLSVWFYIKAVLLGAVLIVYQLGLSRFTKFLMKRQFNAMKKHGKLPYSPNSVVEFYDDRLVEICPNNKSEVSCSMVERISVLGGKAVYIHVSSAAAYIIPFASFESDGQYGEFMEFIKTKNANITVY